MPVLPPLPVLRRARLLLLRGPHFVCFFFFFLCADRARALGQGSADKKRRNVFSRSAHRTLLTVPVKVQQRKKTGKEKLRAPCVVLATSGKDE